MQNENTRNHAPSDHTPKSRGVYPAVCWLYSCAKALLCKYNVHDNMGCDFLSSLAWGGPHILLWCLCPFCWLRLSYIATSGGSISEHSQKHKKLLTVFWLTIRFIWFECCYNVLDFQKCTMLCNQWELPLQICVLQIEVSHPLFAKTLHHRSKLAKCMFSKNWTVKATMTWWWWWAQTHSWMTTVMTRCKTLLMTALKLRQLAQVITPDLH
jgi:hypothetical protein